MTKDKKAVIQFAAPSTQVRLRASLAIVTALSAAIPTVALGTTVYTFDYLGGLAVERGASGMARPEGITIDAVSGEICVTEAVGSSLQVFNAQGVLLFATARAAGLSSPSSGCLDADGNFVCTDSDSPGTRTIRRLDLRGEPTRYRPRAPRAGWLPLHLIVTRDGQYVTLDQLSGLLAKHDARTGALLWTRELGDAGSSDLALGRPCEGHDGRLYIPGGELHQVMVLSTDGEPVTSFGVSGTGLGRLIFPVAAAPGPDGTLAVLDRMRHKVLLFGPDLEFRAEFGAMGAQPGMFYHPVALAIASDTGLAYIGQGFEGRVQVFRLLARDTAAPSQGELGTGAGAAAPAGSSSSKGAAST